MREINEYAKKPPPHLVGRRLFNVKKLAYFFANKSRYF